MVVVVVEPAELAELAELAEPAELVEPAEPVEPFEPAGPVEPAEAAGVVEAVEAGVAGAVTAGKDLALDTGSKSLGEPAAEVDERAGEKKALKVAVGRHFLQYTLDSAIRH